MKWKFENLGDSSSQVDDDYIAMPGEVLSDKWTNDEADLRSMFPGRQEEKDRELSGFLVESARAKRNSLLRDIYDPGIQMVRRELETDPLSNERKIILIEKRTALHDYARLLQSVPDQSGFPQEIIWPQTPLEIK